MYNTVAEMHIALDMGLQHINSNRKQSISPDHKDMALNYAVLQFIETRISPKSNRKLEGLEETTKRYDDLKDLQKPFKSKVYKDGSEYFIIFPSDYYRFISAGAYVKFSKFDHPTAHISNPIAYQTLAFKDDTSTTQTYVNFTLKRGNNVIFDIKDYKGLPDLYNADSKFMIINLILEEVNKIKDIEIYWETWGDVYLKDNFIIISKDTFYLNYGDSISELVKSINNVLSLTSFSDKGDKLVDIDLISNRDKFSYRSNYYLNKNRHINPLATISRNRLIVEIGDNFIISDCILEYYKKPRLISHRHNQSCEIQINREIIDLAVQKLKAYIKDEGYQHVVNENQIIE